MEEMYNTKTAAMNFIHELCSKRPKGNLDDFMSYIVKIMDSFLVCPALSSNVDWRYLAWKLSPPTLRDCMLEAFMKDLYL